MLCFKKMNGRYVNVPKSGHSDDRVPEGRGYASELGIFDILLGIVHDGGEYDDGHGEREQHEAELTHAALERVAENSQALRMTREFEDSKHTKHSQRHERAGQFFVFHDDKTYIKGQYSHHVDHRHDRASEFEAVRCGVEASQVLECEYANARRVQSREEVLVHFA